MNGAWMQSYATDDISMNVNLVTVACCRTVNSCNVMHGDVIMLPGRAVLIPHIPAVSMHSVSAADTPTMEYQV